jgi:hypothetical protein
MQEGLKVSACFYTSQIYSSEMYILYVSFQILHVMVSYRKIRHLVWSDYCLKIIDWLTYVMDKCVFLEARMEDLSRLSISLTHAMVMVNLNV